MRERSHKKGETYQQEVKHWLSRTSFLGFDAEMFGDAYDVTKKACTIGGIVFDFSLRLGRGNVVRHILYGECKYRDERTGNINAEFQEFLKRVCRALANAEPDEAESALFVFLSNLPPDDWRQYLKNKQRYCKDNLGWEPNESPDDALLARLAHVVHLLVLSAPIVTRANVMGLNLIRERFRDWLEGYGPEARAHFLARLEKHVGQPIDVDAWHVVDQAFPRVGSYTSYGIFRLCLQYLTRGDYANELGEEDDVEFEALKEFRAHLKPASLRVPYAAHFLESGDTDTIFIPLLFAKPLAYEERFVASLPGGVKALEAFARGLRFDLAAEAEREYEVEKGQWLPVATAKNVGRLLHRFFTEKPNACVALS